jgi:hypothetical protein
MNKMGAPLIGNIGVGVGPHSGGGMTAQEVARQSDPALLRCRGFAEQAIIGLPVHPRRPIGKGFEYVRPAAEAHSNLPSSPDTPI